MLMKEKDEIETCWYCDCLCSGGNLEYDHMPIPKECGGTNVVASCRSCHDMKDRFLGEQWPEAWKQVVHEDYQRYGRATKIWLAKSARMFAEAIHDREKDK